MNNKAVISISSHVARGSVGNRAAVFGFEALGIPVWSVPTIILPWHPGHGPATRIVPDMKQFCSFLNDIENAPWIEEVGAVLTGYIPEAEQVTAISSLIANIQRNNNDLIYMCDPVLGDKSGLYVKSDVAGAIKSDLISICDIATPNRFELEWLTESAPLDSLTDHCLTPFKKYQGNYGARSLFRSVAILYDTIN